MNRPFTNALTRLQDAGLRPTRQRLALARLLLENGDQHVTAEQLHDWARSSGVKISLATIYNSLHQFCEAGLLREVVVDSGRSWFDTNVTPHHHFFRESTGELIDIAEEYVQMNYLPTPPAGSKIRQVDVIIRLED